MDYEILDNKIIIYDCTNYDIIERIYNVIYSNNGKIESEQWVSKYNDFVIYDYEPACAVGYKLIIELKSELIHNDFILFQLNQQFKNVEHLERCLTI